MSEKPVDVSSVEKADVPCHSSNCDEDEPLLPSDPAKKKRDALLTTFYVALNALAAITIVFLNKVALSDPQLRKAQFSIAVWHFTATFLVLLVASHGRWRLFTPVRLPFKEVIPLSSFFASFLVLNNLSLSWNSVGLYQLSKVLVTPGVVAINWALFSRKLSRQKLLAVTASCTGMALVSVESFQANPVGTLLAVATPLVTACYQVWIGKKMTDLKVDAPQLLLNQAGQACILLLPLVVMFDVVPDLSKMSTTTLSCLLAGGIIASLINLSQFLIIGGTSALTFNVVGQFKMLAIVSIGYYAEGKVFSIIDSLGVFLAIFGVWYYILGSRTGS